ncbi:MAG: hypothetical protein IMY72_07855 [Bacteroidetes bacterium]|nr:hypothetical protein [Bacteroidota bacterium]
MKTYVYVQHLNHAFFYLSLFEFLETKNEVIVFSDNISLFLTIKSQKRFKKVFHTVYLIPPYYNKKKRKPERDLDGRETKVLNYLIQYFGKSPQKAKSQYLYNIEWISNKIEKNSIGLCWSGNKSEALAFSKAIIQCKGTVFFGEITNFPQTIYFDKKGTNYYSSIRNDFKNQLKTIDSESPIGDKYKKILLSLKANQKKIPQSNQKKVVKAYFFLSGFQNYLFRNGSRFNLFKTLKTKFKLNFEKEKYLSQLINRGEWLDLNYFSIPESKEPIYKILIPLQIYSDTQLHVFSKYKSPVDFIQNIVKLIDSNIYVDFKLHPAEQNKYNKLIILVLNKLSSKFPQIRLVDTFEKNEYDIIATINSTFGIDALLSGKKVISFGESLYSGFNFLLEYTDKFKNLRQAIECYDKSVKSENFNLFAKIIYKNFYHFNYFGVGNIKANTDPEKFQKSLDKLRLHFK